MFGSRPAVDRLRDNGYGDADFQVIATPVLYRDENGGVLKLNDKKVYYREDTGDALAIHGE
tara:strand:+ start:797 stop:979 length:183 start_codon:yes stop_codon:yes gene_type:complete